MIAMLTVTRLIILLQFLGLTSSFENILRLKPSVRKIYHYELLHPGVTPKPKSLTYSSTPIEISTEYSSLLPKPSLHQSHPSVIPEFLNNIFHQGPTKIIKDVFLPQLFIPNASNEPAASTGQMENYKKELQEIAMEEEQEQNSVTSKFEDSPVSKGREPKLYVSVSSGLYNYNYTV